MRQKVFSILVMVAFFFLSSCMSIPKDLIEPKVNLQQVNVSDPTMTDATLIFNFLVENPNAVALKVDQVDYDLSLNGKPFTKGILEKGLQVDSKSSALIPVPVRVKYSDLFSSFGDLLRQGTTPYNVKGKVKVGLFSIPFNKDGEVQIKK